MISIHALVKRATKKVLPLLLSLCYFNPRPREEGDSFHCLYYTVSLYFNPRPREEGDVLIMVYSYVPHDFNPRPREEGDTVMSVAFSSDIISIHALVKRATGNTRNENRNKKISIHALVKRATCYGMCVSRLNLISIHALVKRATFAPLFNITLSPFISIHALVKRATRGQGAFDFPSKFQSTPS